MSVRAGMDMRVCAQIFVTDKHTHTNRGSLMTDPLLQSLLAVRERAIVFGDGGRGRGRSRGGREGERRPRRERDPKMSFRDF